MGIINFNEQPLKEYFLKQTDIEFAVLFGSLASGRATPMSDIDIAVYFSGAKNTLELADRQIDITCAVMRFYKINLADVVVLNTAHPFLKFQVVKYGRPIYVNNEKAYYQFKASALGLYQDIKPMYALYDNMARNSLMSHA